MRIFTDSNFVIERFGMWVVVNDKRYGIALQSDEGDKYMVCWKRSIELLNKKQGFYIPYPLFHMAHVFEMKCGNNDSYFHYIYKPEVDQAQNFTDPFIFVHLSKMKWIDDTPHIKKPAFGKV